MKKIFCMLFIALLGFSSCKENHSVDVAAPEEEIMENDTTIIVRETPPGDATDVNAGPATDSITGTGKPVE